MSPPRVKVEPAAKSEADWSSAPASSAGLPEFVEGEFSHMIELAEAEDAGSADLMALEAGEVENPLGAGYWEGREPPTEQERISVMTAHMEALLRVAGKDRDQDRSGLSAFFGRFSDRWGSDRSDAGPAGS
jgi:hypothetical protein